jgi:hypothetical protein
MTHNPAEPVCGEDADPLRLARCTECHYRLDGLPPEGICPECGQAYDQESVVFWGWASGFKSLLGAGHGAPARIFLLCQCCVSLALLGCISNAGPILLLLMLLPLFSVLAGTAQLLSQRATGSIQVHLNDRGFVQRDSLNSQGWLASARRLAGPAWLAYIAICGLLVLIQVPLVELIIELSPGCIFVPVAAAAGVCWYSIARFRSPSRPIPWKQVRLVHLARISPERCVIELWADTERRGARPIVDAEIHCTPEQEKALLPRLRAWSLSANPEFSNPEFPATAAPERGTGGNSGN